MRSLLSRFGIFLCFVLPFILSSCAYRSRSVSDQAGNQTRANLYQAPANAPAPNYADRLPQQINSRGERVVIIDPHVHAWGAYASDGELVRAGLATAGSSWCPDIHRACRTKTGSFRVQSLGSVNCKSSIYPLPKGGAPMPYCMFFNKNQGLHGSHYHAVVEGNVSHGCVRLRIQDAEWLRFNFVRVGTKVIVRPY